MTLSEVAKLGRELAGKATPGPCSSCEDGDSEWGHAVYTDWYNPPSLDEWQGEPDHVANAGEDDAAFFAHCLNHHAALCDAVLRMREALAQTRRDLAAIVKDTEHEPSRALEEQT